MTQHVDDFLTTRSEATHGTAKGLAEGTGQDLNLASEVVVLGDTTTRAANHTSRVALIDHYHGVVFLSEFIDLIERADVTVH